MASRDFIFEIEGLATAFLGRYVAGAPVVWATTLVEAIIDLVPLQTMGVDPLEGTFQSGGFSVRIATAAAYILNRLTSPRTHLTADLTAIATTVTVDSTSAFSASGTIWIGNEAITYSGKTATTFTGCTRAALGTTGKAHDQVLGLSGTRNYVWGFCPHLEGRKCFVRRYDPNSTSPTATTIAAGFIDAITFDEGGFEIACVSLAQQLEEPTISSEDLAQGRLRGAVVGRQNGFFVIGDMDERTTEIYVAYDDGDFLAAGQFAWIKVGDELIKYSGKQTPTDTVISTGSNSFGPYMLLSSQVPWLVGDIITFTDSATSAIVQSAITKLSDVGGLTAVYYSESTYAPAAGSSVTPVNISQLYGLVREKGEKHERYSAVRQVIALDEDHVDTAIICIGSGNGSGSWYDVLPDGVGAGIPESEIDLASFDTLRTYSLPRRTIIDEAIAPRDILAELAQLTGGRIFVDETGALTAKRDFAPYPDIVGSGTLTTDEILSIPSWKTQISMVANCWKWPAVEGEMTFRIEDSIQRYRLREMPEPRSELISLGDSGLIESVALSTLLRYSSPLPEITIEIAHQEVFWPPGTIIALTCPNLPDQQGNAGLTAQYFEVLEFAPAPGGQATVRLLRLPQIEQVGLFAPAGIVSGVAGSVATIYPRSTTHLAPNAAVSSALSGILGGGTNGTEDVHWFLENDPVQLIDKSTLGNSPPTTATTTISAINYATRQITLAAVPGWLADGDIIRLDTHATVASGATASQRLTYFVAWANATPEMPNGDDAYLWGM